MLNILPEHNFQDAFKKMAEALGNANVHDRRLWEGDDGQ
jgi:hypothetical protein